MRSLISAVVLLMVIATPTAASASPRAAGNLCPSGGTPPPGSTITGGLEVDGFCNIDDVTIFGGITVDRSADLFDLFLNGSRVHGG